MQIMGILAVLAAGLSTHENGEDRNDCAWTQWAHDSAHGGMICRSAQDAVRPLAEITIDPFVEQEMANSGRDTLLTHYQVPLLDGSDVFMMVKTGTYVSCDPPGSGTPAPCGPAAWESQIWNEKRFHWQNGRLLEKWSFASDWKPVRAAAVNGWEPMFQPALGEGSIYVPGAGGTVFELERDSGHVVRRINPFGTRVDPNVFVSGGISVDRRGNVYWNAVRFHPAGPFRGDAQAWLVRADDDGRTTLVSYATLIPGAPASTDLCFTNFFASSTPPEFPLPPPPNPDGSPALPPAFPCGSQRPGINVTPAIGADGTVFLVSRAHFNQNYGYVIALTSRLSLKWAASMRDILHDGCGVLVPYTDVDFACRRGARGGVDPFTNLLPAGAVTDLSSSSPVALPDGGVVYGAFTGYNEARGHLFKFDARGAPAGTYDFGWDLTPAVYRHGRTYSLVIKDNHYFTNGPFFITQLSSSLRPEWQYQSTTTQSCSRQPDGTIRCVDEGDHPDGFEWCINAPAVDSNGVVHATSEDGNFYAIGQGGTLDARVFLNIAEGAAYTPLSIDSRGRIYAMNNGQVTVLGE